jgi:hypothetical protein
MARNTLVSLHWLEGKPDTAYAIARETAVRVLEADNEDVIPPVLADAACGMALMVGDEAAAEGYLKLLDEYAGRGVSASSYETWATIARAGLAARRGDVGPGLALLRAGLDLRSLHPRFPSVLTELAECLGSAGAIAQARELSDNLLERVRRTGEGWILSEVQRIRAQFCDDDNDARALLEFALDTARRQGARAWELRAATSLARRWPRTAAEVLSPLVHSFTEGHGTRDLVEARRTLTAH